MIKEEDVINALENLNAYGYEKGVKVSEISEELKKEGFNFTLNELLKILENSEGIEEYKNLYYIIF